MFGAYHLTQIKPSDKEISWRYVLYDGWLKRIPSDNPVALEFTISMEFKSVSFHGGRKTSDIWEKSQNKDANQQQMQPTCETVSGIQTQASLAVVECSHNL